MVWVVQRNIGTQLGSTCVPLVFLLGSGLTMVLLLLMKRVENLLFMVVILVKFCTMAYLLVMDLLLLIVYFYWDPRSLSTLRS